MKGERHAIAEILRGGDIAMANFRRNKPRMRTNSRHMNRWAVEALKARGIDYNYMGHWPASHDRVFHNKPHRARAKAVEKAVTSGEVDPDEALWPLVRKPHNYYW